MASEEKLTQLLEFTSFQLSKDDAVQLLKICDNNLEAAVTKFWDTDPANLKNLLTNATPRWDETAFGSGRYGVDETGGSMPTFNIDYAPGYENYPHSNVQSRAPTRPPSRTSQHSALSTHYGDAPMQSIEQMQESGVIGNSGNAVFGPATKEHYDTAQWAMVPASTEIIPDPVPSDRQREEGHPAFLKPSPRFNYLPALISILHSIPIFRNALLATPDITQRSYWMGDDWWQGNPAIPARVIDREAGLEDADWLEIIYETQRLMAFLDRSDRAYATVSSMFELDSWKRFKPTTLEDEDDDLVKFLLLWSRAYQAKVPDAQLNGRLQSLVNIGESHEENFVFDATVVREGSRSNLSLYDVLDDNLFSAADRTAHITEISKVLVLRLTSATTNAQGLGCRVPATLYADRYMEHNKPVIDGMYRDMKVHQDQLEGLKNTTQRLKYHTPKKEKSKPVESLKLLQTSMKAFETPAGEDESSKDAAVLSQLQNLYLSIESKLALLDAQTKEIAENLGSISNRFKPIVDDGSETLIDLTETEYPEGQTPQDAMHHPYKLCGVATHFGVVYLLHPDTKSNIPGAQQWWRIQYDTETSSPLIRRDRLTQQEVLERAATESNAALLIYAHADAMAEELAPLSKPLEDFVKKDGLNFMEELQKSAIAWEDIGYDANSDSAQGNWANTNNPPDTDQDWASMSAQQFHQHNRNPSNYSSATLTPNTEHDEMGAGVTEMVEVNGGMDALTGISSSASSSTVAGDRMDMDMDVDDAVQGHGRATVMDGSDQVMPDAESQEPRVQHIEIAEKKGG